jgi:hypothetical protein
MKMFEDMAALLGFNEDDVAKDHAAVAKTLGEGIASNDTTGMTNVITTVRRSCKLAKCIDNDSSII